MDAFPDPSNSPVHHTRSLSILGPLAIAPTRMGAHTWIRSFRHVVKLTVDTREWRGTFGSLVQLHGFSSALKSLHIIHSSIHLSQAIDLVCSFPLLEDLGFHFTRCPPYTEGWNAPSTSPKLTGTLHLNDKIFCAVRGLLGLAGGLHFAKIAIRCSVGHADSTMGLVTGCSDTLESISIRYLFSGAFSSAFMVDWYLTTTCGFRSVESATSA
jgi:hypothetical protein